VVVVWAAAEAEELEELEEDDNDEKAELEPEAEGEVTVGTGTSEAVVEADVSSVVVLDPSVVAEPIRLSVGIGREAVLGAAAAGEDPEEEDPGAEIFVMANWGLVSPESPNKTMR